MQNYSTILPTKKTYVRKDGSALLVCPECGMTKDISVHALPKRKPRLKVRCRCGHVFPVLLESRHSFRKETSLAGMYGIELGDEVSGRAIICNLSLEGVCFEVDGRHCIVSGQKGVLDFTLDDRNKTRIRRGFHVQGVRGNTIRCSFTEDRAYEKDLGFYLRPGL